MRALRLIAAELATPSGQVGPLPGLHHRATTAGGHAIVGAALTAPFGAWGLGSGIILAALYWLLKERGDLTRGGAVWDGLEDTVMVAFGAWYGAAWWPAMICAAMGYIMLTKAIRWQK